MARSPSLFSVNLVKRGAVCWAPWSGTGTQEPTGSIFPTGFFPPQFFLPQAVSLLGGYCVIPCLPGSSRD